MMKYSFFNSVYDAEGVPDRPFDANDFSKYFGTLIKDGVFPNPSTNFQVMGDQGSMQVRVQPGLAWIQGHLGYDDSSYLLDIDVADSVLDRIDRVVIRMDTVKRDISLQVKKGEFSAQPVAKELQRDADAWELGIADIRISKGMAAVSQSAITDLRQNTDYCGLVTGTVTQIDTSTFMNQLEQWKVEYIEKTNTWTEEQQRVFDAWEQQFKEDAQNWRNGEEVAFDEWLESIKGKLDGDTAGNLQLQIDEMKNVIFPEREPVDVEYTLEASKWSKNVYSFEEDYPFAEYDLMVIGFSENATEEERFAYGDGAFASVLGNQTIKALDLVPTINIPVVIRVVKKYVIS